MDRSGISTHVAMQISGHKTPSVYKRYRIINQRDLRDAARLMEQPPESTISYVSATNRTKDGANASFAAPVANQAV